jgi:hypothetical protein
LAYNASAKKITRSVGEAAAAAEGRDDLGGSDVDSDGITTLAIGAMQFIICAILLANMHIHLYVNSLSSTTRMFHTCMTRLFSLAGMPVLSSRVSYDGGSRDNLDEPIERG